MVLALRFLLTTVLAHRVSWKGLRSFWSPPPHKERGDKLDLGDGYVLCPNKRKRNWDSSFMRTMEITYTDIRFFVHQNHHPYLTTGLSSGPVTPEPGDARGLGSPDQWSGM